MVDYRLKYFKLYFRKSNIRRLWPSIFSPVIFIIICANVIVILLLTLIIDDDYITSNRFFQARPRYESVLL